MRKGRIYRRCSSCTKPFPRDDQGKRMQRCPDHPTANSSWTWSCDIHAPGTKRNRKTRGGFLSEADARRDMERVLKDIRVDGSYTEPTKQTLTEWIAVWSVRRESTVRANTHLDQSYTIGKWITSNRIATVPLPAITPAMVEADFHDPIRGKVTNGDISQKTASNISNLLHRILEDAVELDLIEKNPMRRPIKSGRGSTKDRTVWSADEVGRFLDYSKTIDPPSWYPLMLTIATTGLRRAEALALTVNDIDVKNGTVTISKTIAGVDDQGQPIFDETKTATSVRTVGLDDEVMSVLLDHVRERPISPTSGLIFTKIDGTPLRKDWVSRKFAEVAEAAPGVRGDGRLHGLRHAWVTLAIGAGVPLSEVSQMAGHSGIQITSDLYGHVEDRYRSRATSKVYTTIREATG